MKTRFLLALLLAAAAHRASATGYVQLQRIWAMEPRRIEAAIKAYPEAFKDGFILSAFPETLKSGPAEVKDFAVQSAFVRRFQQLGVPVQVCIIRAARAAGTKWLVAKPTRDCTSLAPLADAYRFITEILRQQHT